ncbi:MAG: hypothetical protein K2J83_06165, partial [Clostridia bacterium]|nr:hypothetical protein [Clostridia bacterium]
MKINKRNLLTAVLALLCTVALAFGVSFVMPITENMYASAESLEDKVKLKILPDEVEEYSEVLGSSPSSIDRASLSSGSLSTGSTTKSESSINFSEPSGTNYGRVQYLDFKVGVTVPAWAECKISFDVNFAFSIVASQLWTNSVGVYYFKPTTNAATSNSDLTPQSGSDGLCFDNAVAGSSVSVAGLYQDGGTYRAVSWQPNYSIASGEYYLINGSDNEQTFKFSFGMHIFLGNTGSTSTWIRGNCDITLGSFEKEVKDLAVHMPEDMECEYDGNDKSTEILYDIETSEWYSSYGGLVNFVFPNNFTNVIKNGSTIGAYDITANLTSDVPFRLADGSLTRSPQTLKIKINPKGIAVPTIQNSTQTYKADEYEFGLSGYDKDIMSVISYTSNNASAISWDSTAEKLKATDAAIYTV